MVKKQFLSAIFVSLVLCLLRVALSVTMSPNSVYGRLNYLTGYWNKKDKFFPHLLSLQESGILGLRNILSSHGSSAEMEPDMNRDTLQLIQSRGFIAEAYPVVTLDGYILTLHRIRNPFNPNPNPQPILLQHGSFLSSSSWVFNSPGGEARPPRPLAESFNFTVGNSLGFELSNFGFDVWLGNFRGTRYSLGHLTLDARRNHDYWRFSFDEGVVHDLPAFINYILRVTGYPTLSYVGHSFGTFAMFALFASDSRYEEVIKPFIAMSPNGRFTFQTPTRLAAYVPFLSKVLRKVGGPINFPPMSYSQLFNTVCTYEMRAVCLLPVFLATGFSWDQFNYTRFPTFVNHLDTVSIRSQVQILQSISSRSPQLFDYGFASNQLIYGQSKPPIYRFDRINHRYTAIMYSSGDWFSDPQGLVNSLRVPLYDSYLIPAKTFNHLDYLVSKDAGLYVNTKVVQVLFAVFGDIS